MQDGLYTYINANFTGILSHDKTGGVEFMYDENAQYPLSLSLPVKKEKYLDKECSGFFNGLLPEGDSIRKYIAKKYATNPNNDFAILKAIGYDCAGAVSFLKSKRNNLKEFYEIEGEILDNKKLEKLILELPQKPLGVGAKDLKLSLAGAQNKTAVLMIDNKIALPAKSTPTSHILKPQIKNYKESIENEYICMKSAQKAGIKTADVEIRKANETKFLLITRYDRIIEEGKIKRIHQEDFCQAKNIKSAFKYEQDGGIGYRDCFEILRKTTNPANNIKEFANLMIFNFLIGNNDAHGKNYSLIYRDNNIELAPAYDILCSQVYPKISKRMAMKIDKYYRFSDITFKHFKNLCDSCDISYPYFKKLLLKQAETLPDIVSEVAKSFENTIGKSIVKAVQKNCNRMIKLSQEG